MTVRAPARRLPRVLRRAGLPRYEGVTFARINHWEDDSETQLTSAIRAALEDRFAESNQRLRHMLGWAEGWERHESSNDSRG